MNLYLRNKDIVQEILHKFSVLADTPELQEDYKITQEQANELQQSVPRIGSQWAVPTGMEKIVKAEILDAIEICFSLEFDALHEGRKASANRERLLAKSLIKLLKESVFSP